MRFLLSIFLFFFIYSAKSQSISGNFSLPPDRFSAQVYDKSVQNVYYQLSFISNPKKQTSKKEAVCLLSIGEKFSKFGELNAVKYDSLIEKFSHLQTIGAKEMNQLFPVSVRWKPILLRDFSQNTITIQDKAKATYQYSEKQPSFKWVLENQTKNILGYTCYKATTEFRGRKYNAWYAKDIPISNGPYLFNGLPGLIMEIEDRKGDYHFIAVAMDKKQYNIYLRNESTIFKVERNKFREVQKSYHDNPAFFMGKTYDSEGKIINDRVKAKPYNPIELE